MDNIKTLTGLPVKESIRMEEDRDKWRKYVHGVILGSRTATERIGKACSPNTTATNIRQTSEEVSTLNGSSAKATATTRLRALGYYNRSLAEWGYQCQLTT